MSKNKSTSKGKNNDGRYIPRLFVGAGICAVAIFGATGIATAATPGPVPPRPCDVRIHFTVTKDGTEQTRVSGQCHGHAPTAGQIARLAAPLVTTPGIRHRSPQFCRAALGTKREPYGCWEFDGTNTTVIFDTHGRVTTS